MLGQVGPVPPCQPYNPPPFPAFSPPPIQMCRIGTGAFDLLLDETCLEDAVDIGELNRGGTDMALNAMTPGRITPWCGRLPNPASL